MRGDGICPQGCIRDSEALAPVLTPHLAGIADLTAQIAQADRDIVRLGRESYPETQLLQQVAGVGPLTALTFVLTIDDPDRFPTSRAVGAYLGLVPRQRASGAAAAPTPRHQGRRSIAPAIAHWQRTSYGGPGVTLTDVTAQVARHRPVAQARAIPYPRLRAVAKEHTNATSHEYLVIARR